MTEPCNCDQAMRLRKLVRVYALRTRYTVLSYTAPHPSVDHGRALKRWRRSINWTRARLTRLRTELEKR
jgi:hypothetical protein